MVGFIGQEGGDAGVNAYDLSQVPLPPPWWEQLLKGAEPLLMVSAVILGAALIVWLWRRFHEEHGPVTATIYTAVWSWAIFLTLAMVRELAVMIWNAL